MGLLHGVAGGSHFLGVLPALALPTLTASACYLLGFASGTIAAMGLFAAAMGWISGSAAHKGELAFRRLLGGSAPATVLVGLFWVVHTTVLIR